MKIEHVAIWTNDIERLRSFYIRYFDVVANQKYTNSVTNFESYFLSFSEGCRMEIMQMPALLEKCKKEDINFVGLAHLAVAVGSESKVLSLTERLRKDGYIILSEGRTTGDGYFESVIRDPDGNRIEITI